MSNIMVEGLVKILMTFFLFVKKFTVQGGLENLNDQKSYTTL